MRHDTNDTTPETAGILLALKGWSRGCAAAARREFARSLGRKRLSGADLEAFAAACLAARRSVSAATCVAALVLAARPVAGHADILRGSAYAAPRAAGGQDTAAQTQARQRQAAQVQRAREALARTTQAMQSLRLAQDAARSAAMLNAGNVTNGLAPGGLVVAAGVGTDPTLWQNANAPTQTVSGGHTQVEIVQTNAKAILTWDSFNIGKDTEVYFNQTAGGADAPQWIALNRVTDISLNPTQILGSIRAEGQVYVINPNGVIFHGSSQVNAQSLVVSGLDFKGSTVSERNAAFQQGLAADDNRANYNLGVDAGSGAKVGDVTVQAGARLEAGPNGSIYLFGKNVSNAGTILAPDGQALMAAGDRVWITKNLLGTLHSLTDNDLRGVRASVQNDDGASLATNSGLIEADRGNVTITAKNIENAGALLATTTTKANGSVTLLAGDNTQPDGQYWMYPVDFGDLTMKQGSLVAVTPDTTAGTAFATQYRASVVSMSAGTILMKSDSMIYAPSANVTLVAKTQNTGANPSNDPSRIYLAAGSSIFLAGLPEVEVAMSRNTVTGNLRLDELKDAPLQRDGALRGAKVSVDLRRGTTLADMSGYYGLIEYGVEEFMTTGGTLKLDSGSIVTRTGSVIDLSGGSVKYLDGYIDTTRLRGADGRIYDITNARKDIVYTGVYDTYQRFEAGYTQGADAGTLVIGPREGAYVENLNLTGDGSRPYFFAFEGAVVASTATGKYQRNPYTSGASPQTAYTQLARGAALDIGGTMPQPFGPSVTVGDAPALPGNFAPGDSFEPISAHNIVLPERFFDGETFSRVTIVSGGDFTIAAGKTMNLGAFGSLSFHGVKADVEGSILAPGGSVSFLTNLAKGWNQSAQNTPVDWPTLAEADRPAILVGAEGKIDLSGTWNNESTTGGDFGALVLNGGSVKLQSGYDLILVRGASIDVGGGGRLTAKGKIVSGDAGSILLENDFALSGSNGFSAANTPTAPAGHFDIASATLRGFALGKGGKLTIGASRPVEITATSGVTSGNAFSDTLYITPEFFRTGGFASYAVAGVGSLKVADGTVIEPLAQSLIPSAGLWALATGGDIRSATTLGYKPVELRAPGAVTLSIGLRNGSGGLVATDADNSISPLTGNIVFGTGAILSMDPGSAIALYASGDLTVDGTLSAPGGSILAAVTEGPATLRLDSNARLLAPGYTRTDIISGIRVRTVTDAGSVKLAVLHPSSSAVGVMVDRGAIVDISGAAGVSDLKNSDAALIGGPSAYTPVAADSNAGSLAVTDFNGGFFAGRILAGAKGAAEGGSLLFQMGGVGTVPSAGLMLTERLTDRLTGAELFPAVTAGTPATASGEVMLLLPSLSGSGASSLEFAATRQIAFDGTTTLTAARSITFATPLIGLNADAPADSRVEIAAPYVSFSGGRGFITVAAPGVPSAPSTLVGVLTVSAGLIDITQSIDLGGNGLGGFATARFVSTGDIRLTVGDDLGLYTGRLQTPGDLVMRSAQTYVTTTAKPRDATATGFLVQAGGTVTFEGNGNAAPTPYSFGETLTVKATDIVQAGVLRAPLGRINLVATNTLTLTTGSLTSVSADGLVIPMGAISGGFVTPYSGLASIADVIAAAPAKAIALQGSEVRVNDGATVDVSGGGDLRGYEFIPGNGGSHDILNDAGMFAILPGYHSPAAPVYSKSDLNSGGLKAGDSVYLEGVPGLAPGVYTLLPAHYALLPGGFALRATSSGFAATDTSSTLPDGSKIVSGYRTVAGTGTRDTGYTRFELTTGETVRKYSEYNEYGYNDFIAKAADKAGIQRPRLPIDAGSLVIAATDSLKLDGRGRFGAPTGGALGNLDIAATKIALVGDDTAAPAGYLALNAGDLSDFGVGSLILGGVRTHGASGTTVDVAATNILVANDAASALIIPEVIFAATNNLTFADGAVVRAEGTAPGDASDLLLSGNGALARLSSGGLAGVSRTGATTASGDLTIGAGVTLAATGSVLLDGTRSVTNRESAVISAPQLALSSAKVSLGDAPMGTEGLILSGNSLAALSSSRELLLRSYGSIDLYGTVNIGSPESGRIVFDASGLSSFGAAGETAVIAAKEIELRNDFGVTGGSAPSGAGSLKIEAGTLKIGDGDFATTGFSAASASVDRMTASGKGSWIHAGNLTVAAGKVTADAGSDTRLAATGDLTVSHRATTDTSVSGIGGRLALSGASVSINTVVDMPSGIFEATATTGDLTLGDNARISAVGSAKQFFDVTKVTGGGTVRLAALAGSVVLADGSSTDVSGHTLGGDAGTLEITAKQGAMNLDGTVKGTAATGYAGGSFSADAGSVSDFSALNNKLETGGFDASRSVRVRTGDLALAAGETISAHDVSLRADTGAVTIAGDIRATGRAANRDGGTVALRGGAGVTLGDGSVIDVSTGYMTSAKGFDTQSGKVAITADGGDLAFASGATILGAGGVRGGASVVFTAQRDGADLRIAAFSGTVSGFRELIVGGRADYALSNVTTSDFNTMFADAATWMSGADAIKARLGNVSVEIRPDIRVISTGDLTIANDVSLNTRRYGANSDVPGALGFEAAGNLLVNGSVSDGFSTATPTGALQTGRSWNLGFTAGGDITLAANKLIRTGTGDIALDAGRDIVLTNTKSVIYTAGSKTADATGYSRGSRAGDYPVSGGDLSLNAGRDISAAVPKDFVSAWLYRYGFANTSGGLSQSQMTVGSQTGWSVVFANFEQGVGALGGGNVTVNAGHDIRDLSVSLPTTGQQSIAVGAPVLSGDVVIRGGGNLKMNADNDIYGGITMLGRGEATVACGGTMTSDQQTLQRINPTVPSTSAANYELRDLHALFALSDAALTVNARGSVAVEAIVDPMIIPEITANVSGNGSRNTFFFSYTDRTSANITSVAGDIDYLNNPWAAADLARGNTARPVNQQMSVPANSNGVVISRDFLYVPSTVKMTATQGSIDLRARFAGANAGETFRVAPAAKGELELLASDTVSSEVPVVMMDVAPEYLRTAAAPFRNAAPTNLTLSAAEILGAATNYGRGTTPLHANDSDPVRIYALDGSISGENELSPLIIQLPKSLMLRAGKDVADVAAFVQNNNAAGVSLISAGRDILRPDLHVIGEGSVILEAGRDIDMTSTTSTSITSTGNLGNLRTTNFPATDGQDSAYPNLALPNRGADITLVAGAANADYIGFADKYVNPANAAGAIRPYTAELREFMAEHGVTGDDTTLYAAFAAMPEAARAPFLFDVYFSELKETGIDVTDPDSPRFGSYKRGFDAVEKLFGATTPANAGNISLFGRSVATAQGGDIRILAPHGSLAIDVITNPAASSQGVVTQKGGNLNIMTEGDIALANSRVFTLQGGDILMWTSKGDITAGAGSTTRAVPPALVYTVDNDANVLLNAGSLQTGAGIGVLDANRVGGNTSRLDLVAPAGTVDAGDAGIRSVGKINIAALRVVNAANISAGGGVTGVSAAPTVNIAAVASANSASGQSSAGAGDAAQKAQERAAEARSEAPSIFTVEILGYGGSEEDAAGTRVSSAAASPPPPRS